MMNDDDPYTVSVEDQWNAIVDFWTDPCDAPFTVYLRALFPALWIAVITYYWPDPLQIFTGWAKPHQALKAKRGGSHRPRGPKPGGKRTWLRNAGRWTSFDPWDELGRRAPLNPDSLQRSVTPGVAALWNIYDLEQRVTYQLFIAELAFDFTYNWMAGVANSFYCRQQYMAIATASIGHQALLSQLEINPVVWEVVEKARNGATIIGDGGGTPFKAQNATWKGKYIARNETDPPRTAVLYTSSGLMVQSPEMRWPGGEFELYLGTNENTVFHCGFTGQAFGWCDDSELTIWAYPPVVPLDPLPPFPWDRSHDHR